MKNKKHVTACVYTAIVLLIVTICGCTGYNREWDAQFSKSTYASLIDTELFYIQKNGIYRQSDAERIITSENKPIRVVANDKWVACLMRAQDSYTCEAMVYEIQTKDIKTYPNSAQGHGDVFLAAGNLLVFDSDGFVAYDLQDARRMTDYPLVWTAQFQMDGFQYEIQVYRFDTYMVGVLKTVGMQGMSYSIVTSYGNEAEETGRGQVIADITDNEATIISVKNNNEQYSVYRVDREGACAEIAVIPAFHDGNELVRYQFGKCVSASDGKHILIMRKMNGWHKAEIPTQSIYTGDDIIVFSQDWTNCQIVDLNSKKLISSQSNVLFYLDDTDLYRTTTDDLEKSTFEWIEKLPRKWKHIVFSETGKYAVLG